MADDIQWTEADGFPLAGTYVGPQAVLEGVFMRLGEIGDEYAVVPDQFVADGDTVIALGNYTWKHKGTGEPASVKMAHVWTLEGWQGGRLSTARRHREGSRTQLRPLRPPPSGHDGGVYAETERAGLCEFLDLQREALIEKLRGVSDEDARRTPTVSSLSLLSLVKHSAIWERRWFQVVVAGRGFVDEWPEVLPDDEHAFRLTDDDAVDTVVAYYRQQIVAAQEILRRFDLDAPCAWSELARTCDGLRCT